MVQAVASKSSNGGNNNNNEGNWGMGFLLVFFDHPPSDEEDPPLYKRRPSFSLSSPLKSTSSKALMAKTQSTLSICGLLLFTTLLLFTLSTFEPTSALHHHRNNNFNNNNRVSNHHGRVLHQIPPIGTFFRGSKLKGIDGNFSQIGGHFALQGMGVLYRRGTKAMTDLVVGHVAEGAAETQVRSFVRLVHHSGLLSRSDLVLIFDSPESASRLGPVVRSESDSFVKVVGLQRELNGSSFPGRGSGSGLARYMREVGEEDKEALWGKKTGNNLTATELTWASYGSVLGFEASELDPENSLAGFLDHVPMSLRRWACYPMLLGRVRRYFKHTMLVDVSNSLVLSDPFNRIRNRTTESVLIWPNSDTESTRHTRRNSGGRAHQGTGRLNPSVIIGGSRGVRRFANAALTEIVRAVIEHKGKGRNSVTESGLVNQLVHSGHLLKKVNLITPTESIPEANSLAGFNSLDSSGAGFLAFSEFFTVVQRGHGSSSGGGGSVDIDTMIRREICSSHELYSSVYKDCLATH